MYKHLTYVELCTIWHHKVNKSNRLLALKRLTVNELAQLLGKNRSTIYRAINYIKSIKFFENSIPPVIKFRKRHHKSYKVEKPKVLKYIKDKLEIGWSPEEILIDVQLKTVLIYQADHL